MKKGQNSPKKTSPSTTRKKRVTKAEEEQQGNRCIRNAFNERNYRFYDIHSHEVQ